MSLMLYSACAAGALYAAQRVRAFPRAIAIVLFVLPLLFTGRALFTGAIFGPVDLAYTSEPLASMAHSSGVDAVANPSISDVYAEFMPWNDALRRSIGRHEWPLWNPYELCGAPLAGTAQSSPYHPITMAGLLIPIRQSFAFAAAAMLLTAALSAFLFFRELVESDLAALFGAAAWMASTHLLFFAGTALVLAASVIPFVLLGARRVALEPGRKSMAILTTALLLVVLAGHPESAMHIVLFAMVYFGVALWSGGRPRPPAIVSGLAAGLIALLLAAIFLLPIFEVIPQSEEYVHRALGYRQVSSTPAQLAHRLAANFFPFVEGAAGVEERRHAPEVGHGWLATAYAGSMVFAPAIFGFMRWRSRERWFFLGAIVWGLGAGIAAPGIVHLLTHLPGFSIAVNDRMIAFATLGMCALASMGLDRAGDTLAKLFAGVGLAILVAFLISTGIAPDYLRVNAMRALIPVILASCALIVLRKPRALIAVVVLLLLQRAGEASRMQPTIPAKAFYPPFAGLSMMRGSKPFRITGMGTMFTPELSTHYGLEDVRGFQGLTFNRLWETYPLWCIRQPVWSNRVDRLDSPLLSLMNVRFAIAPPAMPLPPWWQTRARYPGYAIVENTRVLPRAFVPRSVQIIAKPDVRTLAAIDDFNDRSVVEDTTARSWAPNGPGTVAIRGNRLQAHMDAPGWVLVSNANWKGWIARERGRRIPLHFGNHAFIAFYLSAGDHEVELTYRPRSFVIGAWISGVTALLLFAYVSMPRSAMTFFMSFQTSFFAEGVRRRYAG
ncbi:MAG TPA: YfhO family protein [Thermoanaerobaculia bacterium]|nr:YfhO family protein [Thermoanaerobaculia bacterium]